MLGGWGKMESNSWNCLLLFGVRLTVQVMRNSVGSGSQPLVHLATSHTIHVHQLGEVADYTGLEVDGTTRLAFDHTLNGLADMTNNTSV